MLESVGVWLLSNASLDRDKDRVFPKGAVLGPYLVNPILVDNHWGKTVGRVENIEVKEDGVYGEILIDTGSYEGKDLFRRVNIGTLNMVSIRFIPIKGIANTEGGKDYSEWELIEVSLVDIPSNREAARLKSYGDGNQIIKFFKKSEMNVIGIVNKWLGVTLKDSDSDEQVENAFKTFFNQGESAKVAQILQDYDGKVKSKFDNFQADLTAANAQLDLVKSLKTEVEGLKSLNAEVTAIKEQLKGLMEGSEDSEDSDGKSYKAKSESSDGIIDLWSMYNKAK